MINKTEFYRELGKFLGVPDHIEITDIHEDCSYSEGCPTCGGNYEFTVGVEGIDTTTKPNSKSRRYYKSFSGKLVDFIDSLD